MNVLHKTDSIVPEFLSGMGEDLKRGLVPLRVFNNREIHELELRRIFARSWVFVAHQTESPNPGDFVTRPIGEDPFICVRDDEANQCAQQLSHRGAQLCRVEMGNTRGFTCPFHGWSHKTNGELVGVPARRQARLAAPTGVQRAPFCWFNSCDIASEDGTFIIRGGVQGGSAFGATNEGGVPWGVDQFETWRG